MKTVELKKDGVYLDGEKFLFIGGEFHYFRTLKGGWRRRLELMRDFGITVVTTYVPWNLHEPRPGEYCFEGNLDIEAFISMVDELGMKMLIRPSPYLCGEFEFGGLPSWLLADRTLCLRSTDPKYMAAVERYYAVLLPKLVPFLHSNGGPIIMATVENEYGSFGNDMNYMRAMAEIMRRHGIDVPFNTCGGSDPFKRVNGHLENTWYTPDFGAHPDALKREMDVMAKAQPNKPFMCGEAWVGDIMFWGRGFETERNIDVNAAFTKCALENNASFNYYMFCGGTNFGFTAGALANSADAAYTPLATSYDYGAPISEEGTPREKYFAMRDELDDYLGKPRRPHVAPPHKIQAIGKIELTEAAPLLSNSQKIATSCANYGKPLCMEDLGQNFGFVRYTTFINYTDSRERRLHIDGVRDRATVYVNGKYIGSILRSHEGKEIRFTVPEGGCELTILVENLGRVGYGYSMYDNKGILGSVHYDIINEDGSMLYNFASVMNFRTETLPLEDLSALEYVKASPEQAKEGTPCFWRGSFKAEAGVDTFLDMDGWKKGNVFVNGFNLGKYWNVGSQRTLYLPGELLSEDNVIEIFELHAPNESLSVESIDHSLLSEIALDPSEEDFFLL